MLCEDVLLDSLGIMLDCVAYGWLCCWKIDSGILFGHSVKFLKITASKIRFVTLPAPDFTQAVAVHATYTKIPNEIIYLLKHAS